ncbi:transporter family-2 protein [Roseovarius nanhaiticus]|uniref:Transporter family-2 protein n=1 Tax=Roseovarius nanhaiticus TaxID=573024 RepID=A0A1N7GEV2_9RHOB|nr:DMT family transporter [Roseovarius nanhaiticus]SEK28358.1 transporter family-2 protein [Roseovarius nanhaiticus]SIS11042.1 transporter family-2 protein [Roseovarius nanhaiticus]
MANQILIATVLMAVAGAMIASQAPINAALGRSIGSPVGAATVSFAIGFAVLLIATILIGDGSSLLRAVKAPPFLLVGGAMGALFVFAALWSVPILGVVTTASLMIFGQMGAALLLDHYGAFGVAQHSINVTRVLSTALVAGGVILSRW